MFCFLNNHIIPDSFLTPSLVTTHIFVYSKVKCHYIYLSKNYPSTVFLAWHLRTGIKRPLSGVDLICVLLKQSSKKCWWGEKGSLTTQIGCSPVYAHVLVTAGLCVGCHSCAEAQELPFKLTGARLLHAGMVVRLWIHLGIVEHSE